MLQIVRPELPDGACQYQTLPTSTGYSHSIVNKPGKTSNDAGLPVVMNANTMKNTMLKICC